MNYKIENGVNNSKWATGTMDFDGEREIIFCVKFYEEPSEFGIKHGRISKLEIRLGREVLAGYDRGWWKKPTKEVKQLYKMILAEFN